MKGGGSLAMWKEYFGAGSHIVGIDIDPACKEHQSEDIEIHIGSQDDPNLIDHVVVENGVIDVVIDDGSHMMEHMLRTFNLLYDRISQNGVYLAEDTHACYWPDYQGGLRQPGSFMKFTKR